MHSLQSCAGDIVGINLKDMVDCWIQWDIAHMMGVLSKVVLITASA